MSLATIFGRIVCRFCHKWVRPSDATGGVCPDCVHQTLDWLHALDIKLAVPPGFTWPPA